MKNIDRPRRNAKSTAIVLPALSLVLASILTACGDSGTEVSDSDTNASTEEAASAQTEPFAAASSVSAAQLATSNTVTVQTALTADSSAVSGPIPNPLLPAAALPVTPETDTPLTVVPAVVVPGQTKTETQTDTVVSVQEPDPATPAPATPDPASQAPAVIPDPEPPASVADNIPDPVETPPTAVETPPEIPPVAQPPTTPEPPANVEVQTSFNSVTTAGFDGEVLDDSIRITWPVMDTARGYNVYRQADYYSTVFTNEFTDTDVFDDDYYYEIQAFDNDDNFEYIATGLTVSARTLGRTDPDAPVPNNNILDNYELVFSEEFQGTELDTSKWNTSFLWGPDLIINGEEQYYVDIKNEPDFGFNPFTFDGEYMTINTIETPDALRSKANNQPYLSGIITSYDAMKFTYGYFETRAKFTHGRGYWPAFWLLNAYYGGADPEIDIMEFIGHNQDVMYHTYHYFDTNGELRSTKSFPVTGIDFTADFHTFGVEWKPGTIIFYVDNYETLRISDANVSQEEMYILVNTAVGGWWAGSPDITTPYPGEYIIDYVRAYQSTVQYDEIQFDQPNDIIPLFSDDPGQTTPNHKPPFYLWPEGYPGRAKP